MAQEKDLYFEDFTVGRTFESAGATLTESQILDFAWAWELALLKEAEKKLSAQA